MSGVVGLLDNLPAQVCRLGVIGNGADKEGNSEEVVEGSLAFVGGETEAQ